LIEKNTCCLPLWSFQGARDTRESRLEAGLSKLNSVRTADVEVDVVLGDPIDRTTEVINGSEAPGDELQIP
jgi:hypothetical protein